MLVKITFFVMVAMILSYANVAYGSAIIKGEEDTVDCPFCISTEELEFRNNHPELIDRISEQVIIFENINYPNWLKMKISLLEIKS